MRDDLRFDQLLREDASALPPAMAVVNPWRDAMDLVLWGIGLTTITLNFLYLALILPLLGAILMVLGFRTLRRENRALGACYGLSIALAVMRSLNVVLPALPVDTGVITGYVIAVLTLALYVCLWRAIITASDSGEESAWTSSGRLLRRRRRRRIGCCWRGCMTS
mgnify:CR=1 FL=1